MAIRILGLDVGSQSVGWALLEEDGDRGRILASGVRIFPEGVDRDQKGGERSKMQARRTARGMRRQIARRAKRKQQLCKQLRHATLLPSNAAEFVRLMDVNPYPLRAMAVDGVLDLHEIGRVLVHLNQRRGFRSNRRTDRTKEKETKGMLAEISELAADIDRTGCRTLGQYLARKHHDFDPRYSHDVDRLRHRHTRREMYEHEFEVVWTSQARHHPDVLTESLKQSVHRTIFFQRDVYWPRSVIGRCELEPKEKRCPKADRLAQRFRVLQEVNNLSIIDNRRRLERRLDQEERQTIIDILAKKKELRFDDARKKLGFDDHVRFNLERAERTKLKGCETDVSLARALGKKRWMSLSDDERDRIVAALVQEDDEIRAKQRLVRDCGLTEDEALCALDVNLPDGYANLSRVAIQRLVPQLERGLLLMGNDPTDSALHAAGYLRPDEREVRQRKLLPSAPDLPNPLVRAALFEVRKLVNSIIREYGLPDRIHVELARDAKKSFAERQEIRFEQASRRQEREAAATEIERWGTRPTRDAIERYRLWLEQERFCIYCGQTISQDQLLSGEVDVDHILPRWRSLDDSLGNKVVCHRRCNRDKGDMTVREWLEASEPERYGHVLKLARKLPGSKNRKFLLKDIALDDFVARQLTDTAYVSRLTTQYLKCLGIPIVMTRGQMTADARYLWGLNNILDPAGRGAKNRTDHRHHAIDAVIIALTDSQRLHNLANDRFENVRAPWRDLWEQAQEAILRINVSHRVRRGVKGALHEEMFYGATQKRESGRMEARITARPWARAWMEVDQAFVRRKPVVEITDAKRLAKVRDATIREILTAHLRDHGIDPVGIKSWKNEARALLAGDNRPRMPSGVPIKKVRMIEEGATFRPVSQRRLYQKVKPGSNHHVVYRTTGPGNSERWIAAVLPMWDAAERARTGKSLIDRSEDQNGRFVMSLSIGESFLIDDGNGGRSLCIVQKMRQDDGRINYKLHTDARKATDISKDNLCLSPEKLRRLNAQKVTVDPVGRVRRSND